LEKCGAKDIIGETGVRSQESGDRRRETEDGNQESGVGVGDRHRSRRMDTELGDRDRSQLGAFLELGNFDFVSNNNY